MTPAHDARSSLLRLLAKLSFKLGEFKLSSGASSDYYIDCRTTTLHAEGGRLTGLALLELFHAHGLHPEAVGGLTLGADPVVSGIAIASAQRAHEDATQPLVHGFLVRKGEKAHGMRRRIEGYFAEGSEVVIVDDVCTTGASTIEAIEVARAAGLRVTAAACLVERTEARGRAAVEAALQTAFQAALQGSPFLSLFTADDVRAAHIAQLPL